ncbi:MAG: hypothetical protein ACI90V_000104 [Bacillariaceae sp.]|jgi:hypothetical protein
MYERIQVAAQQKFRSATLGKESLPQISSSFLTDRT